MNEQRKPLVNHKAMARRLVSRAKQILFVDASLLLLIIIDVIYDYFSFDQDDWEYLTLAPALVFSVLTCLAFSCTCTLLIVKNKQKEWANFFYASCVIYDLLMMLSSVCFSFLDLRAGRSIASTFLLVSVLLTTFISYDPVAEIIQSVSMVTLLIGLVYFYGGNAYLQGDFVNWVVFLLFMAFLEFTVYHRELRLDSDDQKLLSLSYLDSLSTLPNRRAFDGAHQELLEGTTPYVIALGDVNDFKQINDTFGHKVGDQIIQTIGTKLHEQFGETAFRYGGDEFAILCTENRLKLDIKIDEINETLISTYPLVFSNSKRAVSFGAYERDPAENNEIAIFHRADAALYFAKKHKVDSTVFYSPAVERDSTVFYSPAVERE